MPLPTLPGAAANTAPHLIQIDEQQRVWLVSEGNVTVLTAKEFHQFAQASTTRTAASAAKL